MLNFDISHASPQKKDRELYKMDPNLPKIVVIKNASVKPLCLKNKLAYVFRNDNPVSC